MKKSLLLFGANSFVARSFIDKYSDQYTIYPVYRRAGQGELVMDFTTSAAISGFHDKIPSRIDGVIFLQGINPSMGCNDITESHFLDMLKVNLVTPALLIRELQEILNDNCSIIFFSSISRKKGSYDPSYASAKAGLFGLMQSLANAYSRLRFNMISLGLVENSPVFTQMTGDFRERHASHMRNGEFVKAANVCSVIDMLITNDNINRADINVDNGYA